MSTELMEIIEGISQVMAKTYDGALDEKGNKIKAGLRREEGVDFHKFSGTERECRLLDGFRARVGHYADREGSWPCLNVSYHTEVKLEEAHDPKLEDEIEARLADAVKYLKKEFKKVTGKELVASKEGELEMRLEQTSRIRTFVTAKCCYKIGNVEMPKLETQADVKRSAELQKWLALGGFKK